MSKKSSPNGALIESLLSYDEMAAELRISTRELRTLVYRRVVPALVLGHRTVRFQRSAVARALQKREVREVG